MSLTTTGLVQMMVWTVRFRLYHQPNCQFFCFDINYRCYGLFPVHWQCIKCYLTENISCFLLAVKDWTVYGFYRILVISTLHFISIGSVDSDLSTKHETFGGYFIFFFFFGKYTFCILRNCLFMLLQHRGMVKFKNIQLRLVTHVTQ